MNKKPLFFLLLMAFICLSACSDYQEKKLSEAVNVKDTRITKIVFSDGRGRNKPFSLTDPQKIKEFVKKMDGVVVKKENSHEPGAGWTHRADYYSGDKKLFEIVFNNPLQINNDYYVVVKGQLKPKELDEFIQSADSKWKTSGL